MNILQSLESAFTNLREIERYLTKYAVGPAEADVALQLAKRSNNSLSRIKAMLKRDRCEPDHEDRMTLKD